MQVPTTGAQTAPPQTPRDRPQRLAATLRGRPNLPNPLEQLVEIVFAEAFV